jgi:flagella basal body P-ring formation protein FlgA
MYRFLERHWSSQLGLIGLMFALMQFSLVFYSGSTLAQEVAVVRVPVPRQIIYPGQSIEPSMIAWRIWRGRGALKGVARQLDDLVGKIARNTLLPSRIIFTAALREPFIVDKGQVVGLFFKLGGIEIHSKGIAHQAGVVGEMVRVQNVDSGRVISGTIQSDGSVRVGGHHK